MQVRLDVHEAHIRKQERDLHSDTTSPRPDLRHNSVPEGQAHVKTYWNLIGRSHYRPAVCVNPQQCSSTILVSLRFHPPKLKFGMHIKIVTISILFAVLKLRKSEIISGNTCTEFWSNSINSHRSVTFWHHFRTADQWRQNIHVSSPRQSNSS